METPKGAGELLQIVRGAVGDAELAGWQYRSTSGLRYAVYGALLEVAAYLESQATADPQGPLAVGEAVLHLLEHDCGPAYVRREGGQIIIGSGVRAADRIAAEEDQAELEEIKRLFYSETDLERRAKAYLQKVLPAADAMDGEPTYHDPHQIYSWHCTGDGVDVWLPSGECPVCHAFLADDGTMVPAPEPTFAENRKPVEPMPTCDCPDADEGESVCCGKYKGQQTPLDVRCLQCVAERPGPYHSPPTVPADVAEGLRLASATVRGSSAGRYRWEAQDGEVHLTLLNPNAATIAEALEFCKLHNNRPTLEEWSAANGGEEAAVQKFCNEQASPPWALLHNLSQGVYRIVRDETGGYGKTDSSAAKTLAAACEAAKRPAPWGPGKAAETLEAAHAD
jgi:hypothetical protein